MRNKGYKIVVNNTVVPAFEPESLISSAVDPF